jgi:DNA-binding CsgD family transcriptional regulator
MKKIMMRFSTILIYLILVLSLSGFDIVTLIDLKSIVLVVLGTIFLSLSSIKRGMKKQDICSILSWNAIVVSYLTTFIFLFMSLSTMKTTDNLLMEIALNCRTLLYGFIIFVLLKSDEKERIEKIEKNVMHDNKGRDNRLHLNSENEENIAEVQTNLSAEDIYYMFRELGLTQRESEIARLAKNGLSNKEIADEMYIAESTVKKHMSHIFEKLQLSNRENLKNIKI